MGRCRRRAAHPSRSDRSRERKNRKNSLSAKTFQVDSGTERVRAGRRVVATQDRIYFAQRAAEEQDRAITATDPDVAEVHRRLQRAYLERASVGDRQNFAPSAVYPD